MKKLKLKALELGAKEVLTREQLKMVLGGAGGSGSGSGSGSGKTCTLRCDQDSTDGVSVADCSSETINSCSDVSNAVCTCG